MANLYCSSPFLHKAHKHNGKAHRLLALLSQLLARFGSIPLALNERFARLFERALELRLTLRELLNLLLVVLFQVGQSL